MGMNHETQVLCFLLELGHIIHEQLTSVSIGNCCAFTTVYVAHEKLFHGDIFCFRDKLTFDLSAISHFSQIGNSKSALTKHTLYFIRVAWAFKFRTLG